MQKPIFNIFLTILITTIFSISTIEAAAILDKSFGTNGTLKLNIGTDQAFTDIIVQDDGKIVVGGAITSEDGDRDIFLARYNSNGSLDDSFGDNGISTVELSHRHEDIYDIELQDDGKVVAVGRIEAYDDSDVYDFLAVRFNTDGSLDSSFGENGFVTKNQEQRDRFTAVTIQDDGKILAVGRTYEYIVILAVLVRFNADGTDDTDFRGGGFFEFALPRQAHSGFRTEYSPSDIGVLNDGKIFLGGTFEIDDGPDDMRGYYEITFNSDGSGDVTERSKLVSLFRRIGNPLGQYQSEVFENGSVVRCSGVEVSTSGRKYKHDGESLAILPNGNVAVAGRRFAGNLQVYSENAFIGGAWSVPTGKLAATPESKILITK